jgi:hypothetical protein
MKQTKDSKSEGRRKERNISKKKSVWRAALGPRDALSFGKSNWVGTNFQNGMIDRSLPYLLNKTLSGQLDTWAIGRRSINPVASKSSSLPDVPFSVSCRVV